MLTSYQLVANIAGGQLGDLTIIKNKYNINIITLN